MQKRESACVREKGKGKGKLEKGKRRPETLRVE